MNDPTNEPKTNCDEEEYYPYHKKCPKCGGNVHSHYCDMDYIAETGEEYIYLKYHCHQCGTVFDAGQWDEMEYIEED